MLKSFHSFSSIKSMDTRTKVIWIGGILLGIGAFTMFPMLTVGIVTGWLLQEKKRDILAFRDKLIDVFSN